MRAAGRAAADTYSDERFEQRLLQATAGLVDKAYAASPVGKQ
jgi:hypothetical protein